MDEISVGIVGGGASGMMAAITAAESGAKVTLFEKNERVGRKILMTGNGKCNFGNKNLSKEMYYSENIDFAWDRLKSFNTEEIISFFECRGLMTKEKNGYLYPLSEQASVMLDILRLKLSENNIDVRTDSNVYDLSKTASKIKLYIKHGNTKEESTFDRVILTCGGMAAPKTGSDGSGYKLAKKAGHSVTYTVPALVQLRCSEKFFNMVAGVRTDAVVSILDGDKIIASERGELQLVDYGISGIPVFQLSRVVGMMLKNRDAVKVRIDFLSDIDENDYSDFIKKRLLSGNNESIEAFFTGMLNKKLMQLFIKLSGLKPNEPVKTADNQKLYNVFYLCRKFEVTVIAANPFDNAQVTAGGVSLNEIDENFESKKMKGLFFAGEILDVDGKCGGYNLQWAWCSGKIAGESAAGIKKHN